MVALPKVMDKDLGWAAMLRRVAEIEASHVRVGIVGDAANESDDGGLTVAEYGAVNEFGSDHIPARPFLRPTFDDQREQLVEMGKKLIGAVIDGKMRTEQALGVLGASLASAVKKRITSNIPPPNAPSTALDKTTGHKAFNIRRSRKILVRDASGDIKKKTIRTVSREARTLGEAFAQIGAVAGVKTLIDTGRLLNAITWIVELGE